MSLTSAFVDLTPLRVSPAFRRLWLGRVFSGFGAQMTLVAVMFQVWEQTRSTIWPGLSGSPRPCRWSCSGCSPGRWWTASTGGSSRC